MLRNSIVEINNDISCIKLHASNVVDEINDIKYPTMDFCQIKMQRN
jgi:hypothetical protein